MALVLPTLLCLGCGILIVNLGCSPQGPRVYDLLLRAPLSIGYGIGLFSAILFVLKVLGSRALMSVDLLVFALLLIGFLGLRFRRPISDTWVCSQQENRENPRWFNYLLNAALAIALGASLYFGVMHTVAHPNGDGWDAFAIWNLHARFLFLGGSNWRDGFTPLIAWSHPDYPLLLPAAVAHFWSFLGRDSQAVPAVIGLLFTFSIVGILFSSLSILDGGTAGKLGALILLTTPSFIEQGTSQYADIPLSFFVLATIVLLCLYTDSETKPGGRSGGQLALAGFAAAFAAWTKNEGVLFFCAIILARAIVAVRGDADKHEQNLTTIPFLPAAIPLLLLVIYFKRFVATPGDLFSSPSIIRHRLLDPARYWVVIRWFVKEFLRFGHWLGIPTTLLMLGAYLVARPGRHNHIGTGFRISVIALCLTLAGYFVIYVITPYDLYWHLRFSLTRLFLQLWPSAIFLFFHWMWDGEGFKQD